jgi:hypothetical protein
MGRLRGTVVSGALLPAVVGLLSVAAAAAADVRTDLESLGRALDDAVLQVSRPARAGALPRGVARGYRIVGFGAMFVLAPRTLPAPQPVPSPEEQRRSEIDLRMREKTARRAAGEPEPASEGAAPAATGPRTLEEDLQELAQDVEIQLRLQAEASRMMGDGLASMPADARADYERQMRALHAEAESFRQRAERRRAMAEQSVLATLGISTGPLATTTTATLSVTTAPVPQESPALEPAAAEEGSLVRPWTFWGPPPAAPVADPDGVIRNVGIAVARVLETQGSRLAHLPPQESVAVAIDFIPATARVATARPARTLMVRVRKSDIDARATGAIDATEFTKRVEVVEY